MRFLLLIILILIPKMGHTNNIASQIRMGISQAYPMGQEWEVGLKIEPRFTPNEKTQLISEFFISKSIHDAIRIEGGHEFNFTYKQETSHTPYLQFELSEERDLILFQHRIKGEAYQEKTQSVEGSHKHWMYLIRSRILLGYLQHNYTPYFAMELFIDYALKGFQGTLGIKQKSLDFYYALDLDITKNLHVNTTHIAGIAWDL